MYNFGQFRRILGQQVDNKIHHNNSVPFPRQHFYLPSGNRRTTFALWTSDPSRRRGVSCRLPPRPSGSPGPGPGPGAPLPSPLRDRESKHLFADHFLCNHLKGCVTLDTGRESLNPLRLMCLADRVFFYGITKNIVDEKNQSTITSK